MNGMCVRLNQAHGLLRQFRDLFEILFGISTQNIRIRQSITKYLSLNLHALNAFENNTQVLDARTSCLADATDMSGVTVNDVVELAQRCRTSCTRVTMHICDIITELHYTNSNFKSNASRRMRVR